MAGIIAAQNNNYGIVGINPFAEIYNVKVLDENGRGNANNLIKGIKWCIDNDIDLINISFGYQKDNKKLKDIIDKAISKNIIIVAAAGNTYGFKTDYPANYNNVISVTSLDKELQRSSFAALGKIDFALPGEEILSTDNNGDYSLFEGTSFATAYASGVISVLLSKYKNEEIKLTFSEYIKKFVVNKEEWDTVNYGKGLLKITN
ncbi:S8 family serine peptidase [Cytobacillus horneckiae]|nr:S8 family serine peptidase [Cytobacillus horneckiae]